MVVMSPERRQRNMDDMLQSEGDDGSSGPKSAKRGVPLDKNSDAYKRRRERNNLAVKKSRSKSKMKTQETLERVNKLKVENEVLEAKIKLLSKELSFLKDLFLAHAGSAHGGSLSDIDLSIFNEPSDADTGSTKGRAKTTVKTESK